MFGLYIKSTLFFGFFVLITVYYGLGISLGAKRCHKHTLNAKAEKWARLTLLGLERICGLTYQVRGLEHMPEKAVVVMVKHQSTWETIALRHLLPNPQVWILKQELLSIPVFGQALSTFDPIAINRNEGSKALKHILREGGKAIQAHKRVVIFPEGTRTPPGTRGKYSVGGGMLARQAGVDVVPIAHNAGVYWRRHGFLKYPGTIQLVIGPAIATDGLSAKAITAKAEHWIESTMDSLPASQ